MASKEHFEAALGLDELTALSQTKRQGLNKNYNIACFYITYRRLDHNRNINGKSIFYYGKHLQFLLYQ